MVLQKYKTDLSYTLCSLLEQYCRQIKQTYDRYCANCQNGIVDKLTRPITDTVRTIIRDCRQVKQAYHKKYVLCQNGFVDKSNRPIMDKVFSIRTELQTNKTEPIIDTVLTIKMVWKTNQTDLSQKIYSPLERYCRQIKQVYHMQFVLYQNGIVDKSNIPIIDTVLAIRAVLQKNQTDISQTICFLLERYCRQMKESYHRHYVLCQNGIVDKSNKPIMDNLFYIRTVLQTNQTELSQTLF